MRVSTSAAFYALFLATAEAGPLRAGSHQAPAVERRQGGIGGSIATVVTFVPGDAFGGVSSLVPAAPAAPSASATGRPLPTKITALPTSTAVVDRETYKSNQDKARQLNEQFSTLTPQTPCAADEVGCIDGGVASCSPLGTFNIAPCPGDTRCFALPMAVAVGVRLECVSPEAAKTLLEDSQPPSEPAVSSSQPAASSSVSGGFTRTATVVESSGSATITLTFDPNASAPLPSVILGPSSLSSTTSLGGIPFPVVPIPSTTTIFTTVFPSAAPQPAPTAGDDQPPAQPSKAPEEEAPPVVSKEPPRTRTRTRTRGRPQPPVTSSVQEPGEVAAEPTERPEPGTGGSGSNEDTRVTFTRVETVTVTEKETVTVTAGAAEAAQTGRA